MRPPSISFDAGTPASVTNVPDACKPTMATPIGPLTSAPAGLTSAAPASAAAVLLASTVAPEAAVAFCTRRWAILRVVPESTVTKDVPPLGAMLYVVVGGSPTVTENAADAVTVSDPVVTGTSRGPTGALAEIVMLAVALVEVATETVFT